METIAVVVLVIGVAIAMLYVTYDIGKVLKDLLVEIRKLRVGIDELRLTSRARIGQIKPHTGSDQEETQLVRLGRTARVKRILVGGDQDYDELRESGRKLASERDDLIAQGVDPSELKTPIHPIDPRAVDNEE